MESITYVRQGSLVYQDRSGNLCRLEAGEFQHTSVRGGLGDRTLNGSFTDCSQVFHARITPDRSRVAPRAEKRRFSVAERLGTLRLVGSRDGRSQSLHIHQDVSMYSSVLLLGTHLVHELDSGRCAWLHVVKGHIVLGDHRLRTGDGAAFFEEAAVSFTAQGPSEILLFDLG
jgi:redox-sensitive bicupin YhaK (pirin superfamily)